MILRRQAREGTQHRAVLALVGQCGSIVVKGLRPQRRTIAMLQPCHPVAPARCDDAAPHDLRHAHRTVARVEGHMSRRHHLIEAPADRREDLVGVEEGSRRPWNHAGEASSDHGALLHQQSRHRLAIERWTGWRRDFSHVGFEAYARTSEHRA